MSGGERARQIILDRKIARVIQTFSEEYGVSLEEATELYYNSVTAALVEEGVADLHCRSDKYLAEELMLELKAHDEGIQQL